jgi:hypothetical protein
MDTSALISGVFGALGTVVFLFLGYRLANRSVQAAVRLPAAQFALFWIGLAAVSVGGAFESLWAVWQVPPIAVAVTVLRLELLIVCAALWGLLGYLTYLYTGRNGLVFWSVFYGIFYVALLFLVSAYKPTTVTVVNGTVSLQYGTVFAGPLLDILFFALIAPEFIGAVLYFTLIFRSRDPTVRFRVTVVSWSLILWLGLSSLSAEFVVGTNLVIDVLVHSLGWLAALAILIAYYPPKILRDRLGVTGIDSPRTPLFERERPN